jgi:hypothetical protein
MHDNKFTVIAIRVQFWINVITKQGVCCWRLGGGGQPKLGDSNSANQNILVEIFSCVLFSSSDDRAIEC